MKIRVAFVDGDSNYLEHIKAKFWKDYSEEIETSFYSSVSLFAGNYSKNRANIAVVSTSFMDDVKAYSIPCEVLFLSEDNDEGTIDGYKVIGKYQRMDDIYRQIVNLYSDTAANMSGFVPARSQDKKISVFVSPAGGCGSSTIAVAYAEHLAAKGLSVMYMNLEKLAYYPYGKESGFEDILYSLKEKQTNIALKIESMARKSPSGVYYIPGIKNALDIANISDEEISILIGAVSRITSFKYVVLDIDFTLDKKTYSVLDAATGIEVVTDGSEIANAKTQMALNCIKDIEASGEYRMSNKIGIIYNRFSAGSYCTKLCGEWPEVGTLNRYKATTEQIIGELSKSDIFDKLD